MPYSLRCKRIYSAARLLIFAVCLFCLIGGGNFAQAQIDLEVFVGDTTGFSGQENSAISIYMRNFNDSIAGFNLWIQLNQPGIMEFQTNLDTVEYVRYWRYTEFDGDSATDSIEASIYWVCTDWDGETCIDSMQDLGYYYCLDSVWDSENEIWHCIDSNWIPGYDTTTIDTTEAYVGNIETEGTLVEHWERIETRSLGGQGRDMLITAFADQNYPPPDTTTPGIGYPQYGNIPLISILGDIFEIPPEDTNRTVKIKINYSILDYFGFSDPAGNSIGIITEEVPDTMFYICEDWVIPDELCAYWTRVAQEPPEGADSIAIDTILVGHLDTDAVRIYDGSLIVLDAPEGMCGDCNGDENINILDIVFLINYKYKGASAPDPIWVGDVNSDASINILDIVNLINFKYKNGVDPDCDPSLWY